LKVVTQHVGWVTGSICQKKNFPYCLVFGTGFGAFVRHPVPELTNGGFGAYYHNPWDGVISRDQLTGILAGLIAQKKRWDAFKLILHHMCWLMLFSYNTRKNGAFPASTPWKWPDFTGPDIWALEIRALGPWGWPLYPLLCVFDLHTIFNTLVHRWMKKNDPINFAMKIIIGKNNTATPVSLLAFSMVNKDKLIRELRDYWCEWRDGCDIVPFYVGELRD